MDPSAFDVCDVVVEKKGLTPTVGKPSGVSAEALPLVGSQPLPITIRQMLAGVKCWAPDGIDRPNFDKRSPLAYILAHEPDICQPMNTYAVGDLGCV